MTKQENAANNNGMNLPSLLERSKNNFLKKKTKATIGLLVTAILILFTLLGFFTFTPIKQVDENEWPQGGFIVVLGAPRGGNYRV